MTMLGGAILGLAIGGVLGFSAGLGVALVVVAGMVPEMARPKVRVPDYVPEALEVTR